MLHRAFHRGQIDVPWNPMTPMHCPGHVFDQIPRGGMRLYERSGCGGMQVHLSLAKCNPTLLPPTYPYPPQPATLEITRRHPPHHAFAARASPQDLEEAYCKAQARLAWEGDAFDRTRSRPYPTWPPSSRRYRRPATSGPLCPTYKGSRL